MTTTATSSDIICFRLFTLLFSACACISGSFRSDPSAIFRVGSSTYRRSLPSKLETPFSRWRRIIGEKDISRRTKLRAKESHPADVLAEEMDKVQLSHLVIDVVSGRDVSDWERHFMDGLVAAEKEGLMIRWIKTERKTATTPPSDAIIFLGNVAPANIVSFVNQAPSLSCCLVATDTEISLNVPTNRPIRTFRPQNEEETSQSLRWIAHTVKKSVASWTPVALGDLAVRISPERKPRTDLTFKDEKFDHVQKKVTKISTLSHQLSHRAVPPSDTLLGPLLRQQSTMTRSYVQRPLYVRLLWT